MLFKAYQLLRICYYPFFMWIFPLFSSSLKGRIAFEKRNRGDLLCRSFSSDGLKADVAFEISSEGELEQIRPVLIHCLDAGLLVELLFSSESVEKQCLDLARFHSENLRILRMPLICYLPAVLSSRKRWQDPVSWMSAAKLCLCRYDFFPELMNYGSRAGVEFILLSGSLKNYEKSEKNLFIKAYYQKVYTSFDKIVAATRVDQARFVEKFGIDEKKTLAFDFRPLSIDERLKNAEETLRLKFPSYQEFLSLAGYFSRARRLVFGSFWNNELALFQSREVDVDNNFVCVVPHKLDHENIDKIKKGLEKALPGKPVYEWSSNEKQNELIAQAFKERPGVLVINLKGVLCELYTLFGAAFVGGGHGISVHSLLEPFLAECLVYCGPRTHRSTEYDLIRENNPDRLRIVDRLENVFKYFNEDIERKFSSLAGFRELYIQRRRPVLDWLGLEGKNGDKKGEGDYGPF